MRVVALEHLAQILAKAGGEVWREGPVNLANWC